jgi:tetratricopeptide (TPR) repeat protein
MTEDKIRELFQIADRTAGRPLMFPIKASAIRRRAHVRRAVSVTCRAAAALLILALAIWGLSDRSPEQTAKQAQIAALQAQVRLLQARSDATLKLVQEVLKSEREQGHLDELQAELADIPDPLEEIQKQVDKTAFTLVYHADRMYRELGQRRSAVQAYKRVIKLFPQTRSAEVARQRLSEIENEKTETPNSEGDLIWKPQNRSLSC